MGYEARMEAAANYAHEVAREMFHNGAFDDEITNLIMEGHFDEAVKIRYKKLKGTTK